LGVEVKLGQEMVEADRIDLWDAIALVEIVLRGLRGAFEPRMLI
jgi:hypothetical protein